MLNGIAWHETHVSPVDIEVCMALVQTLHRSPHDKQLGYIQ